MSPPRIASVLTAEVLGTFLFFGLAPAVPASALGAVSGAHFNPAVTDR